MALTFKYAILMAVPDTRRGERVNVGIAVFLSHRLDVRISGIAKLRALTGEPWEEHLIVAGRDLAAMYSAVDPDVFAERAALMRSPVTLSDVGWFTLESESQYESKVAEVLKTLVDRPRRPSRPRSTRINTEMANQFKKSKILASSDEDIEARKVVRDYYVSKEEELRADFALRNGVYHVIATLDLRKNTVDIRDACEKAVVLDKAREVFDGQVKRIGVYAGVTSNPRIRPHVELMRDYADPGLLFNWLETAERGRYTALVHNALTRPGGFLFTGGAD